MLDLRKRTKRIRVDDDPNDLTADGAREAAAALLRAADKLDEITGVAGTSTAVTAETQAPAHVRLHPDARARTTIEHRGDTLYVSRDLPR